MNKKRIITILISFMVVGIIIGPASYFITRADIEARSINYSTQKSSKYGATKENVQEAMDEIYDLAIAKQSEIESNRRYDNGEIVYFNPVSNTKCTSSDWSISNSATNYKGDGCMRWFVYLDDGSDTVKLLLDHNTTALVQWYTDYTYVTSNSKANIEINKLKSTNGSYWKVSANDDTIAIKSIGLIDANDIAKITKRTNDTRTWSSTVCNSNTYFFLDTNASGNAPTRGMYWWLYDRTFNCTSYGCNTADSNSYTNLSSGNNWYIDGYWTSTNVGTGSSIWVVTKDAYLNCTDAPIESFGVRPVITVLRSKLM